MSMIFHSDLMFAVRSRYRPLRSLEDSRWSPESPEGHYAQHDQAAASGKLGQPCGSMIDVDNYVITPK